MFGQKIEIDGLDIHYEKVGDGPNYVLLLPGGIGSSRTDFSPQIENGFNKKDFTLIAWDPPGYGYSRPPVRVYDKDVYLRDAEMAAKLMKKLGINFYSIMGWSDGAKTALLMAIKFQSCVNKAVVWGGCAYCTSKEKMALSSTRNIQVWNPKVRDGFLKVYGDELQSLWEKHVDHYVNNLDDICKNEVKKIQCPVFVLHGDIDPLIPLEHPNYLVDQIPDSRLHRFAKGSHNIHQEFAQQFNQIVQQFLLE